MPAKNRIGREQSADLFESLATENLALNCQSTSLVVIAVGGSSLRLWLRRNVGRKQGFARAITTEKEGCYGSAEFFGLTQPFAHADVSQ